ncbi:peptide-binding protein [Lentisphaerota bacterium ZTH]|nr:peptide-binding protein [Lentisphaerota bacterium]WET05518.1 peptide-binding protein [Lentisphaerota bacterium ZTH]
MNKNLYLNLMLTVGVIAIIIFGILMVNAVDRVHSTNRKIIERLGNLEESINEIPGRQIIPANLSALKTQPISGGKPEVEASGDQAANAEFFDPKAQDGGRIIQASLADAGNMNFLINNDNAVSECWQLCNSALAERNYKDPEKFQPLMAKSWSVSKDKMVYTINLRKGIMWHDFTDPVTGKEWKNVEVTANDFKFYLDAINNKDTNCAPYRVYYHDIKKFEVINKYKFKVYWGKRYFRSKELTLSLNPLPRHLYHAYKGPFDGKRFNSDHKRNRMIVGCGPYKLLRWDKDRRIVFVRNEKYFGKKLGIMPPIKYRVLEIIKHPNTQFQALMSNNIDRISLNAEQWVNRTNTKEFGKNGRLKKYKFLSRMFIYIGYNLKNPLFEDRRVRLAMTHLIDRRKILKDVFYGLGKIITGPFFYDSPYYDKSIKPYEFNVEKAKKLLAEAGWKDTDGDGILEKDGRKFEFTFMQIANSTAQQKMLPVIKEDLAKAGINMHIQTMEWSIAIQRLDNKEFDACCMAWTQPYESDPYQVWHSSQADRSHSSNYISFKNAEADRLIEEIRRTFDVNKRIELCHKFQQLLHKEQPYTFMIAPYNLLVQNKRYKNMRKFPLGYPTTLLWTPKAEQLQVPNI